MSVASRSKREPADTPRPSSTGRESLFAGAVARCRWILASASLRLRPGRSGSAAPATSETIRQTAATLDTLDDRFQKMFADEERRLASMAGPAPAALQRDQAWLEAAARLTDEIASLEPAPDAPAPRRRDIVAALFKVEAAIAALELAFTALDERAHGLESRIARLQLKAEAAVTAGDDSMASRALARRRTLHESLADVQHEVDLRRKILAEWKQLADLFEERLRRPRQRP